MRGGPTPRAGPPHGPPTPGLPMGFRFWRRIKLMPGVTLNLSKTGASLSFGAPGVLHGSFSYVLQDDAGQIFPAHSISAGLDYPG
ncbi:MAG: DUF4236 domain-containing protein, partial [Planctomycetota bacterium]